MCLLVSLEGGAPAQRLFLSYVPINIPGKGGTRIAAILPPCLLSIPHGGGHPPSGSSYLLCLRCAFVALAAEPMAWSAIALLWASSDRQHALYCGLDVRHGGTTLPRCATSSTRTSVCHAACTPPLGTTGTAWMSLAALANALNVANGTAWMNETAFVNISSITYHIAGMNAAATITFINVLTGTA